MMKKMFLLTTLIGFVMLANAQSDTYHAFKFDIGLGGALPSNGSGTQGGATFTLQPHYRLSDGFALGLRIEAAAIGYKNSSTGDVKISALASTCLSGEFYLSNNGFRPFIGGGVGAFDQETASGNTNDNNNSSGGTISGRTTNFGVYPVLGFEAGHFRMSVEYDVTGQNNNYVALKIGAFFGGGRKKVVKQ
jgi:outer membrane protein W